MHSPTFLGQVSVAYDVTFEPTEPIVVVDGVGHNPVSKHTWERLMDLINMCKVRWVWKPWVNDYPDVTVNLPTPLLQFVLPVVTRVVSPFNAEARLYASLCFVLYAYSSYKRFYVERIWCIVLDDRLHDISVRIIIRWVILVLLLVTQRHFFCCVIYAAITVE